MFCPKCSQKQVSDEQRFCSRCGFQLDGVNALLAADGLPSTATVSRKRAFHMRDATIGATLMFFFAFVVTLITIDLPPGRGNAKVILLLAAWLILSLLINIKPIFRYFVRDGSDEVEKRPASAQRLPSHFSKTALPDASSVPVDVFVPPARTTADLAPPRSVTEDTTDLLRNV